MKIIKSKRKFEKHDVWATELKVKDDVSWRKAFKQLLELIGKYEEVENVESLS